MPVRYRRSIKLGPALKFNINKRSMGFSVGVRGAHYTVNTNRQRTTSLGLPGTGMWCTQRSSAPAKSITGSRMAPQPAQLPRALQHSLPKPGLFAPAFEKQFYTGVKAYIARDLQVAYVQFGAVSQAQKGGLSANLFAGVVANQLGNEDKAIEHLEKVVTSHEGLPDRLMDAPMFKWCMQIQLR